MIVLDKALADADACKNFLIVTFEEESTRVFEDSGLEHQGAGKRSFQDFHGSVMVRILALSAFGEDRRHSDYFSSRLPRFRPALRRCIHSGKQSLLVKPPKDTAV